MLANHAISRAQQPRQGGSAGKRSTLTNLQFTPDGSHAGAIVALLYCTNRLLQRALGNLLVLLGNRIDPDRQEIQQLRVTKGRQAQMLWPEQVPFAQCIEDAFQQHVGGGDQGIGQRSSVEHGEHLLAATGAAELLGLQHADLAPVPG